MNNSRCQNATRHAEKLVKDEKLILPIDLAELGKRHNIVIEAKPASAKGVSGMLLRAGDNFAIGYATHINNTGFQRFSIAHELGHYFLPGHSDHVFSGGKIIHESHAGFGSGDQIELEADHFAAGLLMPSHLFKVVAGKFSDGFTAIEKAAERCQTSLTAAAIRYAELTDAAVAIILSSGTTVDYCFTSSSLRGVNGFKHPKKGTMLPRNSLTIKFNQDQNNILTAQREEDETDLITWFHTDDEIEATEEVVGLGNYGSTLTIVCADLPDEDDDVDDMTSKPPRFR